MAASQALFHFLMVGFVAAVFAEFEIISRVGENATLEAGCDENLVAWENNTEPFYALLMRTVTVEMNGTNGTNATLQNITVYAIRVLADSMPIIPILFFDSENGTERPVICATPPPDNVDTALIVVVYITSSLSIICCVIALVTYLLFKPLRTLPGLVLMNLFLAFLLGEIVLQVRFGFEYHGERLVEPTVLHQGLITARFLWMSITGFEMCRTLYRGVRLIGDSQPREKWMLLGVYMAVGWSISSFLTVIMYIVEKIPASEDVIEVLGINGHLTTIVPISLSLLLNIAMVAFISVIFFNASLRQRRLQQNSYKKQNVNFVRLFVILLIVLGIVWIVFFALAFNGLAEEYIGVAIAYAIVTDTQPIFVCIAFIFTPKVFKMYLVKFNIRTKEDLRKKSRRTGTLTSLYSERELYRGKTIMSMVSEKEFQGVLHSDKISPTLHTIAEEAEETEDIEHYQMAEKVPIDSSVVSNGSTHMAVGNGTAATGTENTCQKTEDEMEERPDSLEKEPCVEDTQPNTSTASNGTMVTADTHNAVNALSTNKVASNPSLNSSLSSLNPDREETSV